MKWFILVMLICVNTYASVDIIDRIRCRSVEYGIDAAVMVVVAKQESNLNPNATNWNEGNGRPSRGLFQIQFNTAKEFCKIKRIKDLYNIDKNIDCAMTYMKYQLKRYNYNYVKAVSAYNAGTYTKTNKKYVKFLNYLPTKPNEINEIYRRKGLCIR